MTAPASAAPRMVGGSAMPSSVLLGEWQPWAMPKNSAIAMSWAVVFA